MSLTKASILMIETPLSGVLGGSGVINHPNSFIIGNGITTLSADTLYVNNLSASGYVFGSIVGAEGSVNNFSSATYAPTISSEDLSNHVATTAFVKSLTSSEAPSMDSFAFAGSGYNFALANHVHPSDTSRAPVDSPTFTTAAYGPTISSCDLSDHLATTAFVKSLTSSDVPLMNSSVAFAGDGYNFALANHVHPSDTSRAPIDSPIFTTAACAPTPIINDNSACIATTCFVNNYLKLAGGTLTGNLTGTDACFNNLSAGFLSGNGCGITNLILNRPDLDRAVTNCQGSFVIGCNALSNEAAHSSTVFSGTSYTRTATTVTLTNLPIGHNIYLDDFVIISSATDAELNGIFHVVSSSTTEITFENPTTNVSSGTLSAQKSQRSNLALGQQALNSLTTGCNNIAIGYDANTGATTSNSSVTIGNNSIGDGCATAIGTKSRASNWGVAVGTGSEGTGSGAALGYQAYAMNSGSAVGRDSSTANFPGAIALGRESNATCCHLALGSVGYPLRTNSISTGRNLEINLNGSIGYVPVANSSGEFTALDPFKLPLSGGTITGNLSVAGNFYSSGSAVFANTIFTTTSALSVVNTGPGPALYVYQAPGTGDVASFYDGDGIEVLHVGNNGYVGVRTSTPNAHLTVSGDVSATKYYGDGSGLTNISGSSGSDSTKLPLSGGSLTGTLTGTSICATVGFYGNHVGVGSGLTNINASNISSGTIGATYLPTVATLEDLIVAVSDETTNLSTGTSKTTFRMPFAMTLNSVRASVNTAPAGSTITIDVNQNGTSIFSTLLSIDASEKTSTTAATPAVLSTSSLTDDAEITVDIDQVGSATPGKGLKLVFKGARA